MKRLTYSLIIVILFFGCNQKNKFSNKNPDNLSIDLTLKSSPKISFGYLHESISDMSVHSLVSQYHFGSHSPFPTDSSSRRNVPESKIVRTSRTRVVIALVRQSPAPCKKSQQQRKRPQSRS